MKNNIKFDNKERISFPEREALFERLKNNLVVGAELETQNTKPSFRTELRKVLEPNDNWGCYPLKGVHQVTTDGSLYSDGNVEVIVSGISTGKHDLHKLLHEIETSMLDMNVYHANGSLKEGFYTDEKTGEHISVLTGKPTRIPAIIGKNVWQITRNFVANIAHLTSAGIGTNVIRNGAREYAQLPRLGKSTRTMSDIKSCSGGKSTLINMGKTSIGKVEGKEVINDLFVEFRIPDRIMSSSIETALMLMFKAIILKATNISAFGLLRVKQDLFNDQQKNYKRMVNDNKKTLLEGKNPLFPKLVIQTKQFLKFLKKELDSLDEQLYPTLIHLAENPVWVRSIGKGQKEKKSWLELDEEFSKILFSDTPKHVKIYEPIMEILENRLEEYSNEKEAITQFMKFSKQTKPKVIKYLQTRGYLWNDEEKIHTYKRNT